MLKELITPSNAELAISKFRTRADELSKNSAKNLAMAIARAGDLFPAFDDFLISSDPANQAAMLIGKLLKQIESPNRYGIAEPLAREAEPLPFACRVVRWVASGNDTPIQDRRLTPDEDIALWKCLAIRIKEYVHSNGRRIFEEPRQAMIYFELMARGGYETDAQQFLTEDVRQNPSDAILFISGFLPISYTVSGSKPGEFEGNTYDRVSRLVAPSLLHDCIVNLYGDEVANPVYTGPSDRPLAETIAHQFEYVHKRILAEAAPKQPAHSSDGKDDSNSMVVVTK